MATVTVKTIGAGSRTVEGVSTVQDVLNKLGYGSNYQVRLNGDTANKDSRLNDDDYLTLSAKVKGG